MKRLVGDILEFMLNTGITYAKTLIAYYGGEWIEIYTQPDGGVANIHGRPVMLYSKNTPIDTLYLEECYHDVRKLIQDGMVEFMGVSGEHIIKIHAYSDKTWGMTVDGEMMYNGIILNPSSIMSHFMGFTSRHQDS